MTTYSYSRVSTGDQNVDQQSQYLRDRYAVEYSVEETFTGTTTDRPQFQKLLRKLKSGDVLVVKEVSRIGRNTSEVLEVTEELKGRRVQLVIDQLGGMDVTSSAGEMMLTMLAAIAKMERETMLERQKVGIDRAKAEGKYKGRKPIPAAAIKKAMAMVSEGATVTEAAKHWKVGRSTLYNRIKEAESRTEKQTGAV